MSNSGQAAVMSCQIDNPKEAFSGSGMVVIGVEDCPGCSTPDPTQRLVEAAQAK